MEGSHPPEEEPPGLEATVRFAPEGGTCFWLEGRGPLSPSCTKRYVIKTPFLHFWSTGTPNPGVTVLTARHTSRAGFSGHPV